VTSLPDDAAPAETAFTTERLVVRDWADADAERMLDMYSRDEVVRFLGSAPNPMATIEQAYERIARGRVRNRETPPCGWWAVEVRDTGVVAGTVAVVPVDGGAGEIEVAWHLHPDSQGRGYATEAARGALEHARAHGVIEVLALTDPANSASQAVCRRLGMGLLETSDRYYGKPLMIWLSRRPTHGEGGMPPGQ
jgi:RimJ/RimL family protein N-acetyltransferase